MKRAYVLATVLAVASATAFAVAACASRRSWGPAAPGHGILFVAAVHLVAVRAAGQCQLTGSAGRSDPAREHPVQRGQAGLVLALAAGLGGYGILVSWVVPAALAVVPVVLAVFKVFIPAHLGVRHRARRGTDLFRRFVAGDGLGMLLAQVHTALLPILVMEQAGAETAGRFLFPGCSFSRWTSSPSTWACR